MIGCMPYLLHIQWRLDLGDIVLDIPFKVPDVDGLTYRSCHYECAIICTYALASRARLKWLHDSSVGIGDRVVDAEVRSEWAEVR